MLNLMIKPASGRCQMRCTYCFYADETKERDVSDCGIMSEQTLSTLLDKVFCYERQAVSFVFQGGEPTLAGLSFYQTFLSLVQKKNFRHIPVCYSLQTNGYCIDARWAKFLSDNHFLVGLSIDGISDTHDTFRKDASGMGTYSRALHAAERLSAAGCSYNILTVVTKPVASKIKEIYTDYRLRGFTYQQYVPCLDSMHDTDRKPWSLDSAAYEIFLKELFALYCKDMLQGRYVYIRRFDNWCAMAGGRAPEECSLCGRCTPQLVIEANGDAFPCDFYSIDSHKLGNILEHSIQELFASPAAGQFFLPWKIPSECLSCRWRFLCRGGCPRERDAEKNKYCSGLRSFFACAYEDMVKVFQKWNCYT